jgi:hypothetical protein
MPGQEDIDATCELVKGYLNFFILILFKVLII